MITKPPFISLFVHAASIPLAVTVFLCPLGHSQFDSSHPQPRRPQTIFIRRSLLASSSLGLAPPHSHPSQPSHYNHPTLPHPHLNASTELLLKLQMIPTWLVNTDLRGGFAPR